ncbi:hypothetical protein M3I54_30145 [Paraburkholderia sp. CNPSo 3274]|nr:hypothetical protein [Paraburkholderia sp. CNPSo 3274]MCP3711187.1 hypothetical protein [Paraburkholderia sp. CNPSo 3274]
MRRGAGAGRRPERTVALARSAFSLVAGHAAADPLLDGLLRLVAAHFGVAAACVVPGAAPAERGLAAGVDETLSEALRALAHGSGASGAREPLIVPDIAEDPAWRNVLPPRTNLHCMPNSKRCASTNACSRMPSRAAAGASGTATW